MHLKELNYIVMLADEQSISRAADRLYMAQSSLSQFLQQYEAELGVKLFVRTSKGIRPTAAGNVFIENARSILMHYRLVQNELWDMGKLEGGNVILGISTFRAQYMLPQILTIFRERYPKVRVDIVEENSKELENQLVAGSVDVAIVALPLTRLEHQVEFLKRDEILLVANRKHPVMEKAHRKEGALYDWVDLKDTEPFEYILSDYDTILGGFGRQQFKKAGIQPITHYTNITAALAAVMARKGLGLAFTYRSCAESYEDAVYLSIGEKGVYLELALAYPHSTYQSKAAKAMGAVIQEVLDENLQNGSVAVQN